MAPFYEWFFKSSYFNIRQSADNLEQKISTKIDPFGDMSDYIKTVKPYTSKLRDFNDRKTHTEITGKPKLTRHTSTERDELETIDTGAIRILRTPRLKRQGRLPAVITARDI